MKIIAGTYKGRNFYTLKGIRPTQGIVRKALFDILGQDMEGVTLLDLFAGSGAVGLEALSRGAKKAVFVDNDPRCAAVIGENIGLLSIRKDGTGIHPYEIFQTDAFAAIKVFARQGKKFDVVFIDPPYSRELAKKALKTLEAYDILHPACHIVIQHDKKEILPDQQGRFLLFRQKKYGSTIFSIYKSDLGNTG
jgi:16S rRNA (guanine(966)-N(2))-methyltransferase RsmD